MCVCLCVRARGVTITVKQQQQQQQLLKSCNIAQPKTYTYSEHTKKRSSIPTSEFHIKKKEERTKITPTHLTHSLTEFSLKNYNKMLCNYKNYAAIIYVSASAASSFFLFLRGAFLLFHHTPL
jgi:hypothetical protein